MATDIIARGLAASSKQAVDGKQDKLIAGQNITIAADGKTISATAQAEISYIELTFYNDGDTGTLTEEQKQTLLASELNYIWLNNMHRLDFKYRDNNNNKATYSACDTSTDGNKIHSVEINLSTKGFTVYHRVLQEYISDLGTIRSGAALGATSVQSVKTINGSTITGTGNVEVKTYQPFPNGQLSGTLQEVVNAIMAFPTKAQGMAYLGGISGACTPFGYGNVECKVEFMTNTIAILTANSSNIYPYHWEYNTADNSYKWKKFLVMPEYPSDFSTSTYVIKFINGAATWVKE